MHACIRSHYITSHHITSHHITLQTHIHTCIHIHIHTDTCIHTCMHACIHTYIHTYNTHMHMHMHACTHTYIHTHTHMYTPMHDRQPHIHTTYTRTYRPTLLSNIVETVNTRSRCQPPSDTHPKKGSPRDSNCRTNECNCTNSFDTQPHTVRPFRVVFVQCTGLGASCAT